uniref:Methionine--tRNA ligase, mitochondrial n=1 Tax=Petromyzon marinus TaxID=7757 RepID=A0AAJ7WVB5_PETMA|nr:methionine--tRNA ligase, mitochondrial [Petromyzon marinus]
MRCLGVAIVRELSRSRRGWSRGPGFNPCRASGTDCAGEAGGGGRGGCEAATVETSNATPRFYVSTPIFYVNAAPHIGHLYSVTLADCLQRRQALCGHRVRFSSGTDEHGLKIQQAAVQARQAPAKFCTSVSERFKALFAAANVGHTDWVRTTEPRHFRAVNYFWRKLRDGGHIHRGSYEGWYCTAEESFLANAQVTDGVDPQGKPIKVSAESGHPVDWTSEDNYIFRLSTFTPKIEAWLQTEPHPVFPEKFRQLALQWLHEGLPDLSVSRPHARLQWGIPVPDDPTQTIYVWLDALVNYLTITGYPDEGYGEWWPCDLHVLGKDILKFHALYWPAFLMAAGLEPPRRLLVHSHWTVAGRKMSKSLGNSVDPNEDINRYSADGLRYFLLRQGVPESDGDYYPEKVEKMLNAELSGTLGGLLNRCVAPALNPEQIFPQFHRPLFPEKNHTSTETGLPHLTSSDYELITSVENLPAVVQDCYDRAAVYQALDAIAACLHKGNAFVQRHAPWKITPPSDQEDREPGSSSHGKMWHDTVLHVAMETLRVCGILLQPAVPGLASKLLDRLGIPGHHAGSRERSWESLTCFDAYRGRTCLHGGQKLGSDSGLLFPRIDGKIGKKPKKSAKDDSGHKN